MSFRNGNMVKDISRLGRNYSQTILIDFETVGLEEFSDNRVLIT